MHSDLFFLVHNGNGVDIRDFNFERKTKIILMSVISVILGLLWISGIVTYVVGIENVGGCLLGISVGFTIFFFIVVCIHYFCDNGGNEELVGSSEDDNDLELKEVVIEV